jgi:hypothetical protein
MKRRISSVVLRSAAAFAVFTGGFRAASLILKALIRRLRKSPSQRMPANLESVLERFSPAIAAASAGAIFTFYRFHFIFFLFFILLLSFGRKCS